MKWFRKNFFKIFAAVVFLTGISVLLYPTASDYLNRHRQGRLIDSYSYAVDQIDTEKYREVWEQAEEYNRALLEKSDRWHLTDEEEIEYMNCLDVNGDGIMGYIRIPCINVSLPIYHWTDEEILQTAIGHMEGSSLPVGGENTHCVVSGHRGLPSAKLFTNLDDLGVGDTFQLHVLNEMLTYEVDQILVVEPDETSSLEIKEGQDLCTLVTCTPYGVNTHRLLVRGHRIENPKEDQSGQEERNEMNPWRSDVLRILPLTVIPMLLLLLILVVFCKKKSKGKGKGKKGK